MEDPLVLKSSARYKTVSKEKANGATYTPKVLADFVAKKIVDAKKESLPRRKIRVLDPAMGDGELLISLLEQLNNSLCASVEVTGFETDEEVLKIAEARLQRQFPNVAVRLEKISFLEFVASYSGGETTGELFAQSSLETFDLVIANPPYVRTQVMGASQARKLSKQFGLSGRIDLYYAFIVGISRLLAPHSIAGLIVSNRFMTTKSGAPVRRAILEQFSLCQVWDLGDTKLFEAAVLPSVLLVRGGKGRAQDIAAFSSIYETTEKPESLADDPIVALNNEGIVEVEDGRRFLVTHGTLNTSGSSDGVWRVSTKAVDSWLNTVSSHTWGTFGDIGKIRVGVKTCADKVFIRSDWCNLPKTERPELLRPLVTHHVARRFKAIAPQKQVQILYPHEVVNGRRRAIDLANFPLTASYLEKHRETLEKRKYVIEAGREWYEIWVPQNPTAWALPKLVFKDIAVEPTFWIDLDGSVINGDCYWLVSKAPDQMELLWLAVAVANSTFIERFYDNRFNNKLYAGRRRFITQYVEQFPIPDPESELAKRIVEKAESIHRLIDSETTEQSMEELDRLVWEAFGLSLEEVHR